MSDRWTPGPWRAVFAHWGHWLISAETHTIAELSGYAGLGGTEVALNAEQKANARLISAAPDMAEDIEKYRSDVATLLQIIAGLPVALGGSDAFVVAQIDERNSAPSAALAKARGQA